MLLRHDANEGVLSLSYRWDPDQSSTFATEGNVHNGAGFCLGYFQIGSLYSNRAYESVSPQSPAMSTPYYR